MNIAIFNRMIEHKQQQQTNKQNEVVFIHFSDQLSQMTLDQEREAVDEPPAKRSKPNNDSSNTSGTSRSVAGRFDIDSLVAPKGPSTCFSKDVQVGPIATREVPMDIDRPSTSALQPKYVPTACSTPVEPAKVPPMIYPLSGPVIKPSQPKTYLPALDNFERKRSKYPTLRVKPKVTAKLAKDQSGSVAHFEDMLITWRPEWIQKYLTGKLK